MKKNWRLVVGGAAIAVAAVGSVSTEASAAQDWTRGLEPCQSEDSMQSCYWDAGEAGNGGGHSFVVIRKKTAKGVVVCVRYVERAYAKKNDNCSPVGGR